MKRIPDLAIISKYQSAEDVRASTIDGIIIQVATAIGSAALITLGNQTGPLGTVINPSVPTSPTWAETFGLLAGLASGILWLFNINVGNTNRWGLHYDSGLSAGAAVAFGIRDATNPVGMVQQVSRGIISSNLAGVMR